MSEHKIFAGPRLRRIRREHDLTQTAMAQDLSISPSYLNLIERNQRPLTVQLLMKLAAVYGVDVTELQGESSGTVSQLKSAFSDPLLAGELPGDQELIEVAEAAPNAAAGLVKLYRAYCEQSERLSDLAMILARQGTETAVAEKRLPHDEVSNALADRAYFFDALDRAAEDFHAALAPADDLEPALRKWLKEKHGIAVKVLPPSVMAHVGRRFDRHTMRLFVSARYSPHDRAREIAIEAVLLALGEEIGRAVDALALTGDEARRIARFEMARYAALAVMMPYDLFLEAARRDRFDIGILAGRFSVSFEQAALRLVSLQRSDNPGLPFFAMEADHAGNILKRIGAHGFPRAGFRGECPKLDIYDAYARPGQILSQCVEMPDASRFLTVVRTLPGPEAMFGDRPRQTTLLLALPWQQAGACIYGAALGANAPAMAVGPVCRLCERAGCLSRARPPITRPLGLDDMAAGLSAFDFQ